MKYNSFKVQPKDCEAEKGWEPVTCTSYTVKDTESSATSAVTNEPKGSQETKETVKTSSSSNERLYTKGNKKIKNEERVLTTVTCERSRNKAMESQVSKELTVTDKTVNKETDHLQKSGTAGDKRAEPTAESGTIDETDGEIPESACNNENVKPMTPLSKDLSAHGSETKGNYKKESTTSSNVNISGR